MNRFGGLLILLFLSGPFLRAESCPKLSPRVKVTLVVILASEEGATTDKRLEAIVKEIQKQNPNLKKFVMQSQQRFSLAEKESHVFQVLENQSVKVVVQQKADMNNRVILAVTTPDQGEIVYGSVCGKFLPMVTRFHTPQKERLILALRVEPCNGD